MNKMQEKLQLAIGRIQKKMKERESLVRLVKLYGNKQEKEILMWHKRLAQLKDNLAAEIKARETLETQLSALKDSVLESRSSGELKDQIRSIEISTRKNKISSILGITEIEIDLQEQQHRQQQAALSSSPPTPGSPILDIDRPLRRSSSESDKDEDKDSVLSRLRKRGITGLVISIDLDPINYFRSGQTNKCQKRNSVLKRNNKKFIHCWQSIQFAFSHSFSLLIF